MRLIKLSNIFLYNCLVLLFWLVPLKVVWASFLSVVRKCVYYWCQWEQYDPYCWHQWEKITLIIGVSSALAQNCCVVVLFAHFCTAASRLMKQKLYFNYQAGDRT